MSSSLLFCCWGWAGLTYGGFVSPLFLPTPTAVVEEAFRQISKGILFPDMWASVYRIMLGWLIATLFAVPIGILMGNFRFFEGLWEPFIDLVRYMPVVALVPLTILWVGIGDEQKFLILFIGVFFQEVLMIMNNVKDVPMDLLRIGYTLGFESMGGAVAHRAAGLYARHLGHVFASRWDGRDISGRGRAGRGAEWAGSPDHGSAALSRHGDHHLRHSGHRTPGSDYRFVLQAIIQSLLQVDERESVVDKQTQARRAGYLACI